MSESNQQETVDAPAAPSVEVPPVVKPAEKHFPVTKQEVDAFASRMEEISQVLHDFLNEDPTEAEERQRRREKARDEEQREKLREKMQSRYDPKYYVRFESDELINKLLEEADQPTANSSLGGGVDGNLFPDRVELLKSPHVSEFEKLALGQADKMKEEGNAAFKAGNWAEAKHKYTLAIDLACIDQALTLALRNNRSQVNLNTKDYLQAVEDASYVLQRHATNTKARLRRATALSALHRPDEALVDVKEAIRGDSKNIEATRLLEILKVEKQEMDALRTFEGIIDSHTSEALKLKACCLQLQEQTHQTTEVDAVVSTGQVAKVVGVDWKLVTSQWLVVADVLRSGGRGAANAFRIYGGLEASRILLEQLLSVDNRVVGPPEVEAVCLAACMKVCAAANSSRVTMLSCTTAAQAATQVALAAITLRYLLVPGTATEEVNGDDAKWQVARAKAETYTARIFATPTPHVVRQRLETSVLQLLTSFAAAAAEPNTTAYMAAVAPEALGKLMIGFIPLPLLKRLLASTLDATSKGNKKAPSVNLVHVLRLLELLLRFDSGVAAYRSSADAFLLPSIAALASPSIPIAEAGVSLLLRLSVLVVGGDEDTSSVAVRNIFSRQEVILSLCEIVCRGVEDGLSAVLSSALLHEGALALLYNVLISRSTGSPSGATSRGAIVAVLHEAGLFPALVKLLRLTSSSGLLRRPMEDAAAAIPVIARALGVAGKSIASCPQLQMLLSDESSESLLWEVVELRDRFLTPVSMNEASSTSGAGIGDDNVYIDQCVEHATLCLAVLYTSNAPAAVIPSLRLEAHLERLLSLLTMKRQPVAVGNAAMILSVVPQSLHTAMDKLNAVSRILQGIVDLRSELHEIERQQLRDSTAHIQTKSAMKNGAVALSRLCATDSLLQKVRDANGFEILYAALDRNTDGTVKEAS